MSPPLMTAVAGGALGVPVPATLAGQAVEAALHDGLPRRRINPQGTADGVIWCDLSAAVMRRVAVFAAATGHSLQEVTVTTQGVTRPVLACLPPLDDGTNAGTWALADWEAAQLAPTIVAVHALLAQDPQAPLADLARQWPMVEARAWARHRARPAPATVRRHAKAEDATITPATPAAGAFFRFQGFDVRHARFDGGRSDPMRREVFVGVDAAMLLPYDPLRDKVLLLEQVRVGPMVRGDANPWMLEPVAGIVDARETPDAAALREAQEEAGITLRRLVPAGQYYPSPGATTDYFHAYVGLCDLTADAPYTGGLAAEGEDIRLHTMTFDAAMSLADSGEIATGPLLHLLYWLARHRDRLRAMG